MTSSPDTSFVAVGAFYIRESPNEGKIWIEHESGEGGEFSIDELEKAIREFYDERF